LLAKRNQLRSLNVARPIDRRDCRECGALATEVGRMSWTGKCPRCSEAALTENIIGLATHSGPALQRWRVGMAASVGAMLLDELESEP